METRSRMSRSLHTNRDFEKLEPYEGKPSRTVLRGEEGSNALDLPDRPSDLQQRDGRGVRAGNEIAKHFAGNNVDVIIYAVEKSLDSYKFNLLHCKQTFISQLKSVPSLRVPESWRARILSQDKSGCCRWGCR